MYVLSRFFDSIESIELWKTMFLCWGSKSLRKNRCYNVIQSRQVTIVIWIFATYVTMFLLRSFHSKHKLRILFTNFCVFGIVARFSDHENETKVFLFFIFLCTEVFAVRWNRTKTWIKHLYMCVIWDPKYYNNCDFTISSKQCLLLLHLTRSVFFPSFSCSFWRKSLVECITLK